jgi:hypothetical protein
LVALTGFADASEYQYDGCEVQRTPYGTGAAEKVIEEATALYRDVQ